MPVIAPDACDRDVLAVVRMSQSSRHTISGTFSHGGVARTIYRTPPGICVGQMLNGKGDLFSNEHVTSEENARYIGMMRYGNDADADADATLVHFQQHFLDGLRDCALAAMHREIDAGNELGRAIAKILDISEYFGAMSHGKIVDRLLGSYSAPDNNDRLTAKARLNSPPPKVDAAGAAIVPGSEQDHVNDGDTVAFEVIPELMIIMPVHKWYITFTLVGIHVLARNPSEMDVARAKMAHERRCSRIRVVAAEEAERDRRRDEASRLSARAWADRAATEREARQALAAERSRYVAPRRQAAVPAPAPAPVPAGNPEGVPRTTCVICESEPVNSIYQCGHACACLGCTRVLHDEPHPLCPMCRVPILVVTPIYLSGYNEAGVVEGGGGGGGDAEEVA